ncbi:hypothetical protein [Paenibacillus dendritiformis]|uniref:hypothetical protein n=1 Tax=Paenibacillus dendritiformis TaxID=130049 RepID=UPI00387E0560
MIDNEIPAKELVAWCNDNGFPVSLPTMYSYMKRRNEAITNGITMELFQPKLHEECMEKTMEGMKKAYSKAHQQRKEKHAQTKVKINQELEDQESAKRIRHDLELLDEMIQKGFNTLSMMEVISPVTAIKAIEMKHKITNGSAGGHTHYGLEGIKLREVVREQAITAAILEFVPEELHDAVIKRMDQATKDYYESIGLGEAYAQQVAREAMEDHA